MTSGFKRSGHGRRLSARGSEVIKLLTEYGPLYGMELWERSDQRQRDALYVTLKRLEDDGYIVSELIESAVPEFPARRRYSVVAEPTA